MNAERILLVMDGLDEDLAAEVDSLRRAAKKAARPIPRMWPWLSAAACFVLIAGCLLMIGRWDAPSGSEIEPTGTAGASSTGDTAGASGDTVGASGDTVGTVGDTFHYFPEDVRYIRDPITNGTAPVVIRTKAELDAVLDPETGARYGEAFFEAWELVVVYKTESSGSIRHRVEGLNVPTGESAILYIDRLLPEVGTCDMAYWQILAVFEKGAVPPGAEITVRYTDVYN